MTRPKRDTLLDRNHFVGAVGNAFQVLDVFGRANKSLAHSEVVRQTGQPKASVHRILSTFLSLGVVARDHDGKYRLTLKLWGLGMAAYANLDLVRTAQPVIESLKLATDEIAHLAVLDGSSCVTYLWKSECLRPARVQFWVGMRTRSWRSSTGRSMLAFLPQQVENLLSSPEIRYDHVGKDSLLDALQKVRGSGFAISRGDNDPERGGVAAPIRDHTGVVVASCGIAASSNRITNDLIRRCVPEVLKASVRISSQLGFRA